MSKTSRCLTHTIPAGAYKAPRTGSAEKLALDFHVQAVQEPPIQAQMALSLEDPRDCLLARKRQLLVVSPKTPFTALLPGVQHPRLLIEGLCRSEYASHLDTGLLGHHGLTFWCDHV